MFSNFISLRLPRLAGADRVMGNLAMVEQLILEWECFTARPELKAIRTTSVLDSSLGRSSQGRKKETATVKPNTFSKNKLACFNQWIFIFILPSPLDARNPPFCFLLQHVSQFPV